MPVTQAQKAQILLELVSPWLVWDSIWSRCRHTGITFIDGGCRLRAVCKWSDDERARLKRNMRHPIRVDHLQECITRPVRAIRHNNASHLVYGTIVFRIGDVHRFSIRTGSFVLSRPYERLTAFSIVGMHVVYDPADGCFVAHDNRIAVDTCEAYLPGPTPFPRLAYDAEDEPIAYAYLI